MGLMERNVRRWLVIALAAVIAYLSTVPHEEVFHLAIVGLSTIMGGAIFLSALIAITNRRLF